MKVLLLTLMVASALGAAGCEDPLEGTASSSVSPAPMIAPGSTTIPTKDSSAGPSDGSAAGAAPAALWGGSLDRNDSSQAGPSNVGPTAPGGSSNDAGAAAGSKTVKIFGGTALDVPQINQNTGGGKYPGAYCGPTSVRMILAYYGTRISADTAASGVYMRGKGASHEGMARKLRQYGVTATLSRTRSLASLKAAVGRGHPVIVNVRGDYGPRRTGGHIIVVIGFDGSGNPIINDPAGGGRHVLPARKFLNAWNGLMIEASK